MHCNMLWLLSMCCNMLWLLLLMRTSAVMCHALQVLPSPIHHGRDLQVTGRQTPTWQAAHLPNRAATNVHSEVPVTGMSYAKTQAKTTTVVTCR
jgi:hypothetical protein